MAYIEFRDISRGHEAERRTVDIRSGVPEAKGLPSVLRFRDFVLIPEARSLQRDGHPLDIGSRAFDLLVILVRHRGQIVPKQTIISFVWPTTLVEESNLRFQMVMLRKVLGEDRHLIKTIPGRGYLLAVDGPPAGGSVGAPFYDAQGGGGLRFPASTDA